MIAPVPPPYGGISNWYLLCKAYIQENLPNVEMTTINTAPGTRSTEGRNIWDRIIKGGFDLIKKQKELQLLIKQNKPDIIHMTTSGQFALIRDIVLLKTANAHGIPAVYHIRFGRIPEISKKNTLEWKLIKKAMSLSRITIAIDFVTFSTIKEKGPGVNVRLIPNPIDFSKLPPLKKSHNNEIVFLGWVIKTKGVEELLKAWNTVGREYSDYLLNIVGPGNDEYTNFLKQKCSVANVCFSGELSHEKAMNLISKCGIFILPSYTEGFPNAVLEAMALGRPIIACGVGAIPDMLSGDCGITIKPGSSNEIEAALKTMLENPEKAAIFGDKARSKALAEYSVSRVFEKYLNVWSEAGGNNTEYI